MSRLGDLIHHAGEFARREARRLVLAERALLAPAGRGTFAGVLPLTQVGSDLFEYTPNPAAPLSFTRANGFRIVLDQPFRTDLASTPKFVQELPGLGKTEMGPAAVVHDWLFQVHHLGRDLLGFAAANRCLEEMLLSLAPPYRVYCRWEALAVREACDLWGKNVWDGTPEVPT